MCEISVIVPIYNAENTLTRCIESLLNQEFKSFEVILVDDGSTDSSPIICDQYSNRQIKVIHKKNGGLSSARNAGLQIIQSRYVCFVDSDDFVNTDYLSSMYRAAKTNDVDLVIMGYVLKRENTTQKYSPKDLEGSYFGNDYYKLLHAFAEGNTHFYFAVNKLFKVDIIHNNGLKFVDHHCAEDMLFNTEYYRIAKSLNIIDNCAYIYTVENQQSLSNRRRPNFWSDMKCVYNNYRTIFESNNVIINGEDINHLLLILIRNTISNYLSSERINLSYEKKFVREVCEDTIVQNNIGCISCKEKINSAILWLIRHKRYTEIIFLVRTKKIVKWHFFKLFNYLRKGN